jgi:hypothetical protein
MICRMRYLILTLAVAIAVSGSAVDAQNRPARKLRVYAYTAGNASGFIDQKVKDRQDSLKDLREAIVKKKDWLELAESAEDADIVVEVVDRLVVATGKVDTQTTSNVSKDGKRITSNTTSTPLTNYTLRTVMRVADYEAPVNGEVSSEYIFGVWRAAAGNVASSIERWAKDNHTRITSRTPGRPGATAPMLASSPAPSPTEAVAPLAGAGAPSAVRQSVHAWLNATTVAAAEQQLPASAIQQLTAARKNARGIQLQTMKTFESALAFAVSQRELGAGAVTVTIEDEAVAGNRAFVTLSVTEPGVRAPYRGTIELIKEGAAWKIAAVDMGRADMRFPRFDSPDLVARLTEYIAAQLRQDKR